MLKAHICKRYDKALADKIIREIEVHAKNLFQLGISDYITLLKDMLLAPCPVERGLAVPNYLKFLFTLLDQGNKNFVCEHDLFSYMQSLNLNKKGETN